MLLILERYLIKLRDKQDVREVILRDFFLENLQDLKQGLGQSDPNQ
jgi:hypothetical protein